MLLFETYNRRRRHRHRSLTGYSDREKILNSHLKHVTLLRVRVLSKYLSCAVTEDALVFQKVNRHRTVCMFICSF